MRLVTLSTCSLNQWALDFRGNLARVRASIATAKREGGQYRVGPELELCGYSCEDHFYERDTEEHSWECVASLLRDSVEEGEGVGWGDLVVDVGMPVTHGGARYNCRLILWRGQVIGIRPKMALADDGNYREPRWFAAWRRVREVEEYSLPETVVNAMEEATGEKVTNKTVPFGDFVLRFEDTLLASETCEELFTPDAPHIRLALAGVEIYTNGSGSHHSLRKLDKRLQLIGSATDKAGGVYLYANQRGCDGNRLYFDGCACIMVNGKVVGQGKQFDVSDVEVVTATVDLDEVAMKRGSVGAFQHSAAREQAYPSVNLPMRLTHRKGSAEEVVASIAKPFDPKYHLPEEEIAYGPACWLWDYLRRSGAKGFLLPLSGGADSASTAAIVGTMCQLAVEAARNGDATVMADVRRIGGYGTGEEIGDANALAQRIFTSVYMGTLNSSEETRARAERIAAEIGSRHMEVRIDSVTNAFVGIISTFTAGRTPKFKTYGGSIGENLALQNIQARCRMVLAFFLAQLLPWIRGESGFLLILGSANVDEGLRGYMTKYDCSSADINPIGGISKMDLKRFLRWGAKHLGYPSLGDVETATPTAELEPLQDNEIAQTDEDDMGMTYEELSIFGRLRTVYRCGPVSMFKMLLHQWREIHPPGVIAEKVKHFFRSYSINRHKMTTITPSYHAENYSPDDNRFDLRQFLYNTRWPWQFDKIDEITKVAETANSKKKD